MIWSDFLNSFQRLLHNHLKSYTVYWFNVTNSFQFNDLVWFQHVWHYKPSSLLLFNNLNWVNPFLPFLLDLNYPFIERRMLAWNYSIRINLRQQYRPMIWRGPSSNQTWLKSASAITLHQNAKWFLKVSYTAIWLATYWSWTGRGRSLQTRGFDPSPFKFHSGLLFIWLAPSPWR